MKRQIIFTAIVATPIIVGAVIVGAPARWSHENPLVAQGVIYRTETSTPSSWDLARAGLASDVVTSRLGYPVTVRLNTHQECLFPTAQVAVTDAELASLVVKNVAKGAPSTTASGTPMAEAPRCNGF